MGESPVRLECGRDEACHLSFAQVGILILTLFDEFAKVTDWLMVCPEDLRWVAPLRVKYYVD